MDKITNHRFTSFDGGIKCDGQLFTPDDRSVLLNLDNLLTDSGRNQSQMKLIPRGAGLSFSGASFGDGVMSIDVRQLDKIAVLESGLQTVTVETGVTVGVLLEYLLSHGFYLPILPGYPTITVGGCIAADVHGKNQARDGNFINQLEAFTLHHVDHGLVEVSRDKNPELFDLTVGGFGLTGTITSATLKVKPIIESAIDMFVQPIENILALPRMLAEAYENNDYIVTWHDFNQTEGRFGSGFLERGVIVNGNHPLRNSDVTTIPIKQLKHSNAPLTLSSETRGVNFPASYCRVVTGVMNAFYSHCQMMKTGSINRVPLHDCYFPSKILRDLYFHGFGNNGLHEYQVIVPVRQFSNYIESVQWWLRRNDLRITMASSKWFNGEQKFLRFNGAGVCFALDFPRCPIANQFLDFLDKLTIETQSTPNINKDSRLPLHVIERTYQAEYHDFRSKLLSFDPKRKYQSELSRRLEL